MKILVPLLVFAGLIALAVRMTLRQFRLDQFAQQAASAPVPTIVGVADENGKFQRVSEGLEEMRAVWHPVRFPSGWESRRSGGFPQERVHLDADMLQRRDWCVKHCIGAWRVEVARGSAPVFWFENQDDANGFTYMWFPFKCS